MRDRKRRRVFSANPNGSPDRVQFKFGRTVNLGNYNNARFEVSVSSDVLPDESVEDAQDRVRAYVMQHVVQETRDLNDEARSRRHR